MRRLPCCLSLLLVAACEPGRSSPRVLASAEIGPDGGVAEVTSGDQAGLQVVVPAGALSRTVRIEVIDDDPPASGSAGGVLAVSYVPPLARPFRVEPADLLFDQPVTLRMPFDPLRQVNTAPGNVRILHTRRSGSIAHPPTDVDVIGRRAEFATTSLGRFQVDRGPRTFGLFNYLGPAEQSVDLADGWNLTSGPVDAASPFAGELPRQWRITGPGFDETWYFDDLELRGRGSPDWRETWDEPVRLWSELLFGEPRSTIVGVQVEAPVGVAPAAGTVGVYHTWHWDVPRVAAGQLVTDVVRLEAFLSWERPDLGTGQRQHVFWFAPEAGLLALAIDGVVHERTAP